MYMYQDIFFISKIELIERRLIDKVKVDHPAENEVTLLTNYKPVMQIELFRLRDSHHWATFVNRPACTQ